MNKTIDKEQGRWQEAINTLCCKLAPEANIDGAGCDSGDPLELSLTEIGQVMNHWQNRAHDALDELGLLAAEGARETSLDTLLRMFGSDDWEPDIDAMRGQNALLNTEVAKLREDLDKARYEAACMKQQRDALLEMTWLDLPDEPRESTATWREEFNRGWERRDVGQNT